MKPFGRDIGSLEVGFGPNGLPWLMLPGQGYEDEGGIYEPPAVTLSRQEAEDLRDWLSEWLDG